MDVHRRFQLKLSQFDTICRFCMKTDLFLKPLFYDEDNCETDDFASDDGSGNETVTEMVALCMQLKISSDDGLPKFMCSVCCDELVRCNNFRRKCLQSCEILKEILQADHSTEDIFDSTDETQKYFSFENTYDIDAVFNLKEQELNEIHMKSDRLFVGSPTRISQEQAFSTDKSMESKQEKHDNESEFYDDCPSRKRKHSNFSFDKAAKDRHRNSTFRKHSHDLKLFRCTDCYKRFKARKYLACHRKVHKRQGNVYKCKKCDNIFHIPVLYRQHMQSHKNLMRKICNDKIVSELK